MEHTEVRFNDNGTLTTVPKHPLVWSPEHSAGKEDDILVLPNIALLVSSTSFRNSMEDTAFLYYRTSQTRSRELSDGFVTDKPINLQVSVFRRKWNQ